MPEDIFERLRRPTWDGVGLNDYFRSKAKNDEAYLHEVRAKVNARRAYEPIYDQTLASYYVHNFFHGRTWLHSREEFLGALAELETAPVPKDDYFDKARFAEARLNLIQAFTSAASHLL
jgi:hypothetical protein